MTLAALFALLVQVGVCTPMHFKTPDRSVLTVMVCGYADRKAPVDAPPEPPRKHA